MRLVLRFEVVFAFLGAAALAVASCQGPDELFRDGSAAETGSAGRSMGDGGGSAGLGGSSSGGQRTPAAGSGGSSLAGRGGASGASGGASGAGGSAGGGGVAGSAGGGGGGTTGAAGTGGGTTGAAGNGGTPGAGGHVTAGAGGSSTGSGGSPSTGAGGTAGQGANCVDTIKKNGYSAPGAPPCSACKDNTTNESARCESAIGCLDTNYPCSGTCKTNCFNAAVADSVVQGCVNALLTAASCS
jgi:hypothetical protein